MPMWDSSHHKIFFLRNFKILNDTSNKLSCFLLLYIRFPGPGILQKIRRRMSALESNKCQYGTLLIIKYFSQNFKILNSTTN